MIIGAKLTLKKLLYDDSGVAMAFTVLVSLFIFMLCASTYAMTENIRKKMELQNACDAAAYSGAVVQADMLSRIAVLNRALSWTYLHTNRRQMDRLVGRWANMTQTTHTSDADMVFASHCKCAHHPSRGIHYRASYTVNSNYDIQMRSTVSSASNVRYLVSDVSLSNDITQGMNNIYSMQTQLSNLRANMNNYIYNSCRNSLAANSPLVQNSNMYIMLNGSVCSNGSVPQASYFQNGNNEDDFLAFSGHTANSMGEGVNRWWNLVSGQIQRQYTGGLTSRYTTLYYVYGCSAIYGCYCTPITNLRTISYSSGETSPAPVPTILNQSFFGRNGSIVVAARTSVNNPFTAFLGSDASSGLYGAFNGNTANMWAIASARAGIRLSGNNAGAYEVQYPGATRSGYTNGVWNLCEEDWDAVMIPVDRAFTNTSSGSWDSSANAGQVLSQISAFPSSVASRVDGFIRH